MRWNKNAEKVAAERGIRKGFVESNLRLFSSIKVKGVEFADQRGRVVIKAIDGKAGGP